MLPIMNAGSVIGRLVGFIGDKWGRCVHNCFSISCPLHMPNVAMAYLAFLMGKVQPAHIWLALLGRHCAYYVDECQRSCRNICLHSFVRHGLRYVVDSFPLDFREKAN